MIFSCPRQKIDIVKQSWPIRNRSDCFTMPVFRLGQLKIVQCVSGFKQGNYFCKNNMADWLATLFCLLQSYKLNEYVHMKYWYGIILQICRLFSEVIFTTIDNRDARWRPLHLYETKECESSAGVVPIFDSLPNYYPPPWNHYLIA